MRSLLLSTLLLVGCAGGQVLKGPDRQDPPTSVVEKNTTKDSNHIYAIIIWTLILGSGIYLFVRNEKSSSK